MAMDFEPIIAYECMTACHMSLNHWSQPVFAEAVAALILMVDMGTDESPERRACGEGYPQAWRFVRRHEGSHASTPRPVSYKA